MGLERRSGRRLTADRPGIYRFAVGSLPEAPAAVAYDFYDLIIGGVGDIGIGARTGPAGAGPPVCVRATAARTGRHAPKVRPAGGEGKARVGDGQRDEGRSSLSFNAWIAIAVGLLVVIVLGLHVPVLLRYRYERKAAAEAALLGGGVDTERHAPLWPMSMLADRWDPYERLFDRAVVVGLDATATDADVALLAGLTELEGLFLENTQVTDAGLAHVAGLTTLEWLYLDDTQVTDAGLVHLAGLAKLQLLNLHNTQVTDAGLVHLAGLPQLKALNLRHTQITDVGLVHLAGLTALRMLDLTNTVVTDAGVVELKRKLPDLYVER